MASPAGESAAQSRSVPTQVRSDGEHAAQEPERPIIGSPHDAKKRGGRSAEEPRFRRRAWSANGDNLPQPLMSDE